MKASVFKEDYIAIILRELLKGLEYLHGEGKLHRGTFYTAPLSHLANWGEAGGNGLGLDAIVTIEVVCSFFFLEISTD